SAALLVALVVARHEPAFASPLLSPASHGLAALDTETLSGTLTGTLSGKLTGTLAGVETGAALASPNTAPLLASVHIANPPPPFTYGRARMIHAPTPCDVPTFSVGG